LAVCFCLLPYFPATCTVFRNKESDKLGRGLFCFVVFSCNGYGCHHLFIAAPKQFLFVPDQCDVASVFSLILYTFFLYLASAWHAHRLTADRALIVLKRGVLTLQSFYLYIPFSMALSFFPFQFVEKSNIFFFNSWENQMISCKINSCVPKAAAPRFYLATPLKS
jgi:hypothetical protein